MNNIILFGVESKYVLLADEKLGEGAFGAVFKGYRNEDPSKKLAIKELKLNSKGIDAKAKITIERETENIRKLNH